ncbi:MAG: protein translocase subunit SecF [Gemmatimonadetes bacterium]|nr:protein translocase subunit SecF [Gemmatimonadota bacterium]
MRHLFSNTRFDFIGVRKHAYMLTAAFFIPGLVLLLVRGLTYSIEFTGGTLVQIESQVPVDVGQLRAALDANGLTGAEIQSFGSDRAYLIRARSTHSEAVSENTETTVAAVRTALDQTLQPGQYEVKRSEAMSPKVGGELRQKAFLAIALSFIAILAYLAIRFEWRFGLASIGATAHDVLGTVMFISLMNLEVSLVIVGALLSVLGLSLNETVIIFDRVRENEHKRLKLDLASILNLSINETLPRTVLTHGTSLSTMATLAIFGGEVIRPFAIVMFFGVFTGIFSSMFIAPVLLMYIRQRWPADDGAPVKGAPAPRPSTSTPAVRRPRIATDGD